MTECLICFSTFEEGEKDLVKLECGHVFHYDCIYACYKHATDSKTLTKKTLRKCPYCRENGGYLPLKDNLIPEKYIHKEWKSFMTLVDQGKTEEYGKFMNKCKCMAICTSGVNKNKQCPNKPKENGYCLRHFKKLKTF